MRMPPGIRLGQSEMGARLLSTAPRRRGAPPGPCTPALKSDESRRTDRAGWRRQSELPARPEERRDSGGCPVRMTGGSSPGVRRPTRLAGRIPMGLDSRRRSDRLSLVPRGCACPRSPRPQPQGGHRAGPGCQTSEAHRRRCRAGRDRPSAVEAGPGS